MKLMDVEPANGMITAVVYSTVDNVMINAQRTVSTKTLRDEIRNK
jgi:hypothetical protein